jgi:hypothetical protein
MAASGRVRIGATISEKPFAGRIGGNQEFTVSNESEEGRNVLEKQPDAVCHVIHSNLYHVSWLTIRLGTDLLPPRRSIASWIFCLRNMEGGGN